MIRLPPRSTLFPYTTPLPICFWPADTYAEGSNPPSFDKQFVRDYLETLDWNKTAPGPRIPADVIAKTTAKYQEDRKSTRLNSSHSQISYAVFCLKKKKKQK